MGRNPNFVSHSINRHDNLNDKKVITIAQQLKIKEFPFITKDNRGNQIYYEDSCGFWIKREYNDNGSVIFYEDSKGYWVKYEYNDYGNTIYVENSDGYIDDKRTKPVPEYTMEELTAKLGHNFKIKK